jgi:SagB-type dehydrogenase family enzyme
MHRRCVRYVLDVVLLIAAFVVFLTGLLVDQLDLNGFAPHRWAGYVVAVLIAIHVGLHWRWLVSFGFRDRPQSQASRARWLHEPGTSSDQAQLPVPPGKGVDVIRGEGDSHRPESAALGLAPSRPSRRVALTALGAGVAGTAAGWFAKAEVSPSPYGGGDVGLFYHRESCLGLRGLISDVLNWGRRPAPYKRAGDGATVALPAVGALPAMSVAQALERRRSLREYADRTMTGEELAWVLSAATGITSGDGYRTAPSAGALYPIETYVALRRVEGIDAGLYHVDVRGQALEPVRTGSVAGDLMIAGLGQGFLRKAPVVLVLTGAFQRTRFKYHERHYRYVCWEGGHVAQNVYLAAEAAGLGACMVGAFLDGPVNDLLRVDGRQEAALGLIALGPR